MSLRASLSLAAVGVIALSACGGGTSTPTTTPADADLVVRARDGVVWDAKSYTVTAADGPIVIYGVNDSSIAHNLHVQDADGNDLGEVVDLPRKGSNGTTEVELEPGSYRIVCTIPGHQVTMNSELVVEG